MKATGETAWRGHGGFTLIEAMMASGIALLLSLTVFEAVLFCNRTAYNVKSRLTADAIAFDMVWDLYNRQLSWLETQAAQPISGWDVVDPAVYDAWGNRSSQVFVFWSVVPEGLPPRRWVLRSNVIWPDVSGNGVRQLPQDYETARMRTNRKLFSSAQ
jgi:hypothetical protein